MFFVFNENDGVILSFLHSMNLSVNQLETSLSCSAIKRVNCAIVPSGEIQ